MLLPAEAIESGEVERIDRELRRVGFIKDFETGRITKSGERIITSLTRSLIRDRSGTVIGSSAILRDISEYKKLITRMSHSEKLSVVGQLAAGIAHEVGNPLTSISSLIQVMTREESDSGLKEKLKLVKKQTDSDKQADSRTRHFFQACGFANKTDRCQCTYHRGAGYN